MLLLFVATVKLFFVIRIVNHLKVIKWEDKVTVDEIVQPDH